MEQKKYWQNFGELKSSEAYQDSLKDEFTEDLPFEAGTGLLESTTPRRDFLKYVRLQYSRRHGRRQLRNAG